MPFSASPATAVRLGPRFRDGLQWAATLHEHQCRKSTDTPYLGHILGVGALVIDGGGDEDQAIAALLHDAVEDQGVTVDQIAVRCGRRVAEIVEACTDSFTVPKLPWRERKEAYLVRLPHEPDHALLVIAADKLNNATSILAELRTLGNGVFDRFNGGRDGTLWFYAAVVEILSTRFSHRFVDELAGVVAEIRRIASSA